MGTPGPLRPWWERVYTSLSAVVKRSVTSTLDATRRRPGLSRVPVTPPAVWRPLHDSLGRHFFERPPPVIRNAAKRSEESIHAGEDRARGLVAWRARCGVPKIPCLRLGMTCAGLGIANGLAKATHADENDGLGDSPPRGGAASYFHGKDMLRGKLRQSLRVRAWPCRVSRTIASRPCRPAPRRWLCPSPPRSFGGRPGHPGAPKSW